MGFGWSGPRAYRSITELRSIQGPDHKAGSCDVLGFARAARNSESLHHIILRQALPVGDRKDHARTTAGTRKPSDDNRVCWADGLVRDGQVQVHLCKIHERLAVFALKCVALPIRLLVLQILRKLVVVGQAALMKNVSDLAAVAPWKLGARGGPESRNGSQAGAQSIQASLAVRPQTRLPQRSQRR